MVVARIVEPPAVVLGIPRGGVVVAERVADMLGWPLDVVVTKKLGAPGNPELGIGAVAPGIRVLDDQVIGALGIGEAWVEAESSRALTEVQRRMLAYRQALPATDIEGRVVVVVDDGVATGGTARAAGRWARLAGATRVILAAPVAPASAERRLRDVFDDVIAVEVPEVFQAVGQWYENFDQVTDGEVRAVLEARSA